MSEQKQHCCLELAQRLGQLGHNEAYISPEFWEQNAPRGWYPGATGPGYYTVVDDYDPRYGGRWTIEYQPLAQCPCCGAALA
jgi:hypothetical protein